MDKGKKKQKLSNDDDCPIHGATHEWGKCHQNQYRGNFKPQRVKQSHSSISSNYSQGSSRREFYYTNLPNQVQVYTNDTQSQYSDSINDNQSCQLHSATPLFWFHSGYSNQNNNNYYEDIVLVAMKTKESKTSYVKELSYFNN